MLKTIVPILAPMIARSMFSTKRLNSKRARFERHRRRKKQPHLVTVYVRINDAHSYLLLQILKQLEERFEIEYDFRTVLNLQKDMYPAPELWTKNAFNDCLHLSRSYKDLVSFVEQQPVSSPIIDQQITAQLLHWELQPGYLDNALLLFEAYWQNDDKKLKALLNSDIAEQAECYAHHLTANEQKLKQDGHYLSAMMHYGGEWYWGINRLQYLERRLNDLGINRTDQSDVIFNRSHQQFCQMMTPDQAQFKQADNKSDSPIEMYYSARSPYSYLGLVRAKQLAEHYGVALVIKPILPMVMRRMQVPKRKGRYITLDVAREAEQYGIEFGHIADPLGTGVENTYALFDYAKSQNKEIDFLESVARGVWSQGISADTEKGLSILVSRAGLNWDEAKIYLSDDTWRVWAQDNLVQLYSNGQWGVPCFKFSSTVVFGQDRLDCIEQAIVKSLV